jgi:septal ring factor EnvC (AmiA/AmiB activator)
MMLREEVVRRAEAEEKLADTQGDLKTAENHIALMEEEEGKHLDDIDKLEKKVKEFEKREKELEKKNKDLQNQLDDQQD